MGISFQKLFKIYNENKVRFTPSFFHGVLQEIALVSWLLRFSIAFCRKLQKKNIHFWTKKKTHFWEPLRISICGNELIFCPETPFFLFLCNTYKWPLSTRSSYGKWYQNNDPNLFDAFFFFDFFQILGRGVWNSAHKNFCTFWTTDDSDSNGD